MKEWCDHTLDEINILKHFNLRKAAENRTKWLTLGRLTTIKGLQQAVDVTT